jgi:hypothetical protein
MTRHRWTWPSSGVLAACAAAYACVATLFTWPLALHLSTKLTGVPSDDLGVYLWNLWVFRREIAAGHSPLSTTSIFSLGTPADLSQHNYTIFSNLMAWPLQQVLGLVASHNIVVLANLVAAAVAMFLLAHAVVRRPLTAWLAGLLFGFSPMLIARSDVHPSLAAAAPLPLFVLALFRLDATRSIRWVLAGGTIVAWAAVCDPYYAVYCAMMAAWFLWTRAVRVRWSPWTWRPSGALVRVIDGMIIGIAGVAGVILATGGTQFHVGPVRVGLLTLYTPNLLLVVAIVTRVLLTTRPRAVLRPARRWAGLVPRLAGMAVVSAALLSPILYALAARWFDDRYVSTPLFWRTSSPGADLLTLLLPNPNHPWLGTPWRAWLTTATGGFAENVTSVTVVAAAVIAAAVFVARFRIPRFWGGLAVMSGLLTLGPFIHVAGVATHVPGPWAILRYVPVLGVARSPARFAVLLILAVAVLVALALEALGAHRPGRRRTVVALAGLALALELCPAPRTLHDATVPGIYSQIAADPRDVRVLELPFGVRDGLSSYGNFSAASQFHQTVHGKRLIGGYLSRVSLRRVQDIQRRPVLAVLMALSEGRTVSQADVDAAAGRAAGFVHASNLAYVVMDRSRMDPRFVEVAMTILDLEQIGQSGMRELYRPRASRPGAVVASAGTGGR